MSERVALVTGAGRGLGRVMALALLKAGHRVFLTATDAAGLDETRYASGAGERVASIAADLGDEANWPKIVEAAEMAFGRIDILVNNAGISGPTSASPLDTELSALRRVFEINTFAAIGLSRLVVPRMTERQWGRLIYVSTSLDTMLRPERAIYGMTKAAGEAFFAGLATSLRSTGVTANVLLPGGPTATRMAAGFGDPNSLLQPDIMAAPIVWLASDGSNGVTGRRFIAAKWNAALTAEQAAQAASAPVAWAGYGDKGIRPGGL
jgi:NAD(P)-dependent dehydrogenase (short-subunit alcohol dehydrogenase family)